ncbi:hypothetical protein [Sphingomonas sp. PB4P5]|uniref:hypothetical protein n=1 Tax=Parasphingomonas puruogangriensis TaxID=3096155 RepID=UPI002FC71011
MNEEDRPRSDVRATTLVIRCWYERGDGDALWLRGTVRDLARGRSLAFEGIDSLLVKLPTLVGDGVSARGG